jgi:hypothetical protein
MNAMKNNGQQSNSRILLFSHKNIFEPAVWRCPFHEFQTIIQEVDSVDVVAPNAKSNYVTGKRIALRVGEFVSVPVNPGVPRVDIDRDYDMFLTVCESASDLLHLQALKDWQKRCKVSVCWLPEFYIKDMETYKSCVKVLRQFDYVIFMFIGNEPFKKIIKGQGHYLPAGIDTLRFCPYPNPPVRSIDVLSIGRRAQPVHQALLRMAEEEGKFYVYDTIDALRAYNLDEHRSMIANLAKRSRYFIVSPGKFDKPAETGGQSEFGYRYFEAAAPGAIMIGLRTPNNPEFDKIFTWEDAVIEVPFTSGAIVETIRALDREPERQMKISRNNIVQCLRHHDWVYRWESLLNIVKMEPLPMLQARKRRLQELAQTVTSNPMELQGTAVR